ncbi:MAG: hypothetical protein RIR11_149 [Bacteroidota bacterium]|jgi:hypothetical protein
MGHIKEPIGVDLNVAPMSLSAEDRQTLSAVIAQYKLTKEVPMSASKLAKNTGKKRTARLFMKRRKPASEKVAVIPSK